MKRRILFVIVSLILLTVAPALAQDSSVTLTVITHDSFAVSEDILDAFEAETGITIRILRSGDTGMMVNQSILSRNNPLGDVMYGVDNTFLSRALAAELFVAYESPLLEYVPEEFHLDTQGFVTPINFGDVCLNYDVAYFDENALSVPTTLEELTEPEYRGLLVVENPASSSPGLAFMLATVAHFGAEEDGGFLDYWAALVANDVLVVDDWSDAYYGQFSATGGERPLVVSYASSPPAEVFFAETAPEVAPTGSIAESDMCFRQIEYAGILAGTRNPVAAQRFIDFLLSREFQEDMPLQMFVFPVHEDAELPEVFAAYAQIPEEPATLDFDTIDTYRDEWIRAWTETVLR